MRIFIPLVLGAIAVLSSCRNSSLSDTAHVDSALAALVPGDTAILVGAKLDKLRQTQVYRKHFAQMALPRLDDFAKETGLDPRKDVSEVLFASNGKQSVVLLARGKFPTSELQSKLEKQGAKSTRYQGYNLYGDEHDAAFFLNSTTALAGSTAVLRDVIDNRGRSAGGIPASLVPLVNAVPADSQAWAVFSGSVINLPFSNDSNLGNLNQIVHSIEHGSFSADLRSGFAFQANGLCTADADARKIHDFLKGIIGIGRLSTPENRPEMLKVYDSIDVKQEGRTVKVSADVPQDVVDNFVGTFLKR